MKVLIVSGFLGAGKTTFIQELVRHLGRDVVIYENELGDADVDAGRLRKTCKLQVWETLEDCVCCTGGRDFASSVLTIASSLDPEYLVVEPTGVARLSGVLDNVRKVAYSRIEVLSPVVVVDGVSWRDQRARARQLFDDQVSSGGTIVVSKEGLAGFGGTEELAALVRELNPSASLANGCLERLEAGWWDGLVADSRILPGVRVPDSQEASYALARGEAEQVGGPVDAGHHGGGQHHHHHDGDDDFQSVTLHGAWLPTAAHLAWQLDALTLGAYGRIDRAKGVVACGKELARFDVVSHAWAMTADPAIVGQEAGGSNADDKPAVFIGQGLDADALARAFLPSRKAAVPVGQR